MNRMLSLVIFSCILLFGTAAVSNNNNKGVKGQQHHMVQPLSTSRNSRNSRITSLRDKLNLDKKEIIAQQPREQLKPTKTVVAGVAKDFSFTKRSKEFWQSEQGIEENVDMLCPITSSSKTITSNGYHLYPTDVFNQSHLSLKDTAKNVKTHKCLEYDNIHNVLYPRWRDCPEKLVFCPILKPLIVQHTKPVKENWPKSYSFCDLKVTTNEVDKPINILVFGNSVTTGVGTQGCKPNSTANYWGNHIDDPDWHSKFIDCAWPHYLGSWFQSISKTQVNMHNVAHPGYTTMMSGQKMTTILQDNKIPKFTNRDIIFLDHSTGDVKLIGKFDKDTKKLEALLEHLIKQIYANSEPNQHPSIVIMEIETRYITPNFITTAYANVAKQYGLYFFSFRNSVHSGFTKTQQTNGSVDYIPYTEFLNFNLVARNDKHPSWYVHLYIAEVTAATIIKEMTQCDPINSGGSDSSSGDGSINGNSKSIIQHSMNKFHGSSSGSNSNSELSTDMLSCDVNVTPMLRITYEKVMKNDSSIIGTFTTPQDNWKLTTDLRGRGGFIRTIANGDQYTTHDNATIGFYFNTEQNIAWNIRDKIDSSDSGDGSNSGSRSRFFQWN